ncbi:MAG TPA: cysteine--tRNA ligase [Dehalococcoidia bacterium]|nr:cysteine--tRNA ligase [Dehalococcoidia bacterium]
MRLYNTMSREKETFEPIARPVTLYVCGVTPYDTTHLGHARTYLIFDVLQRYLGFKGLPVRYVQNVTDVDDPLIAKANDLGVHYLDLAAKYIDIFLNDLKDLNILMPAVYPRATEEIPGILRTIGVLVDQGMAYPRGGSVYFRAHRFPKLGDLSRLDREAMLARNRECGEDPSDPNKEDALDFRLWQAAQPREPVWESPWGPGRPGWHIECSTMANTHLGPRIDLHGGGADLIFPHHSCEIAQSESANGVAPFVKYWMHAGLVWMDGEKMSKSKGNLAFARDLLPVYGSDALRYYLLGFPYREPFEYFECDLAAAAERWRTIAAAADGGQEGPASPRGIAAHERCLAALDDDLNTPSALASLGDLARAIHESGSPGDRAALRSLLMMLGFRLGS